MGCFEGSGILSIAMIGEDAALSAEDAAAIADAQRLDDLSAEDAAAIANAQSLNHNTAYHSLSQSIIAHPKTTRLQSPKAPTIAKVILIMAGF